MKSFYFLLLFALGPNMLVNAQTNYTANDKIPTYNALFTFGTNMGYTSGWKDEEKATLAGGNESLGIRGAGANSLRLSLPEYFLEEWGYGIRVNAQNYYNSIGMFNYTVFLQGPSDAHIDGQIYGSGTGSKMFANMYEPIWDNGENGTPVNDNNFLALYVYKTALQYGENVKFWEIWNEPDYTSTNLGWQSPGSADNWWIRDPKPEELDNLQAPIQHYIRALRVCYEVLKSVDGDDFVSVGGIGYSSFLDAILRNTDNPDNGIVTTNYPLKGGAYFDCVSYHIYPMYKIGSMRHSDRAKEVLIEAKTGYEDLLADYGYNGTTYPKKEFIITETNLPHTPFNNFVGSHEAQRNYDVKAIVACQKSNIRSMHTYALNDGKKVGQMTNSFHAMGLYKSVEGVPPYNQEINPSGIACRSAMHFLKGKRFDAAQTEKMQLPNNVDGAAFYNHNNQFSYVLWAKTTTDNSETAAATYNLPPDLFASKMYKYNWDYRNTDATAETLQSSTIQLTASPCFIFADGDATRVDDLVKTKFKIYPNPVKEDFKIITTGKINDINLIGIDGKKIRLKSINNDSWQIPESTTNGFYLIEISLQNQKVVKKVLIKK